MSDADCTPGREPRSVAASYSHGHCHFQSGGGLRIAAVTYSDGIHWKHCALLRTKSIKRNFIARKKQIS